MPNIIFMAVRRLLTIISILILVGVAVYGVLHLPAQKPSSDGRLHLAASIYPLADIVHNIAPDADVQAILPPGASPHTFEATPAQVTALQGVKLVFVIGHGLDDWATGLATNVPGAQTVTVDKGIKLLPNSDADVKDASDPHYWLSVPNGKLIAQNVTDALIATDPINSSLYKTNLNNYLAKLDQADQSVRQILSHIKTNKIIPHHNAWNYFAQAYGLQVVGSFETSPGREPTPKDIEQLQALVKKYNIKTIFKEPQLSDQAILPFVNDLNIKIATLDAEGQHPYIELLESNAQIIANTLN